MQGSLASRRQRHCNMLLLVACWAGERDKEYSWCGIAWSAVVVVVQWHLLHVDLHTYIDAKMSLFAFMLIHTARKLTTIVHFQKDWFLTILTLPCM